MEYEDNLIQLIDEDGEELNFEHIMTLDYKDKQYIVLTPADDEFFEGVQCLLQDEGLPR